MSRKTPPVNRDVTQTSWAGVLPCSWNSEPPRAIKSWRIVQLAFATSMLESQRNKRNKNIASTRPCQNWQLWNSKYESANILLLRVVRTKPLRKTPQQAAWPKVVSKRNYVLWAEKRFNYRHNDWFSPRTDLDLGLSRASKAIPITSGVPQTREIYTKRWVCAKNDLSLSLFTQANTFRAPLGFPKHAKSAQKKKLIWDLSFLIQAKDFRPPVGFPNHVKSRQNDRLTQRTRDLGLVGLVVTSPSA